MTTKFRVTMRNNSDARSVDGKICWRSGHRCRHNGGKLVIVETDDTEATTNDLNDDNAVLRFEQAE